MLKKAVLIKPLLLLILTTVLFSCASSRRQDGFTYKPTYSAPDIGAGEESPIIENIVINTTQGTTNNLSTQPELSMHLNDEQKGLMQEMVQVGLEDQKSNADLDFKNTVRKMALTYGEKTHVSFGKKQLKRLDRLAMKMEKMHKKESGPDVNWAPVNNLEWAILGAAAVGLFVGIFGVGFGWAVFLIAALAYLYFKLLHNN